MHHPLAILFPGQGAQQPGMGLSWLEELAFKAVLTEAQAIFGEPLTPWLQAGSANDLQATRLTQPLLLTLEVGIYQTWLAHGGPQPAYVAGHSLGEYSALVAAGVLTFAHAFRLVQQRANLMQEACEQTPGAMIAVLRAVPDKITELCESEPFKGRIVMGNINSPDQVVLSGEAELMPAMTAALTEAGMRRCIPLKVGGAFHSPLMATAANQLAQAIEQTAFQEARIPVMTNVDGQCTTAASEFKRKLKAQLTSPVMWAQTMATLQACDPPVATTLEMGPGQVLTGLCRSCQWPGKAVSLAEQGQLDAILQTPEKDISDKLV